VQLNLTGRIALVTGGSRGIGKEISRVLAQAGAHVIINCSRSREQAETLEDELVQSGHRAEVFQADVASPSEVDALFAHIRKAFDRLDVLVNNAGIIKDNLLLNMELSDWERVHDINLKGAFLCTRSAAELMMFHRAGKIINIASVSAVRGGRGQTNYAAAKGGLVAFTRACAVELSAKGIQVNAVLPGMIVTDMSGRVRKRAGEEILKTIPCGRFGEPRDVANLVLFLASDSSDYITGQAIAVDGGQSVS
jgi:3-oxoacyl-[acyl-carrier protein] reductase